MKTPQINFTVHDPEWQRLPKRTKIAICEMVKAVYEHVEKERLKNLNRDVIQRYALKK